MAIVVGNMKRRGEVPTGVPSVYVGRRVGGIHASPFGNPFRVGPRYPGMAAIEEYERWLTERLLEPNSPQSRLFPGLVEKARKGDLILLCWCAPAPCHAEVIKRFIERVLEG